MDVREKARLFATVAHAAVGQVRKYSGEPYIVHPIEVASIVEQLPYHTEAMIAAAYLHDVIEDTHVTADLLLATFGEEITTLVIWLTNKSKNIDGNRAIRKEIDRQHLALAPADAQTIKLADLISNTDSIVENDPAFAKVYLPEKRALLEVLTKGDKQLWQRAKNQLDAYAEVA